MINQKCQYALRALFELSKAYGKGPVTISRIAREQDIPVKFLEAILNELKKGGFTDSRRGSGGGCFLRKHPREISVKEVLQFVQGDINPVGCVEAGKKTDCSFQRDCVFLPMWKKVHDAVNRIYGSTSFQTLLDQERLRKKDRICYSI